MPLITLNESPTGVYQVPVNGTPIRELVITNYDTVNPAFFATSAGLLNAQSSIIPPQSARVFDGYDDVWMSTLSDSISIAIDSTIGSRATAYAAVDANIPGNVNVQGDVNATGVGGFIIPGETTTLINFPITLTVPGQSSSTFNFVNVQNYTSIDLAILAYCTSQSTTGAPVTYMLKLNWFDNAALTDLVYSESVFGYVGNSLANNVELSGSSPVHGQYLQIEVVNLATGASLIVGPLTVTGSFRTPVRSSWASSLVSASGITINGVTTALPLYAGNAITDEGATSGYTGDLNLGSLPGTTPGSGLRAYLLPLYAGPVWLRWGVATAALTSPATIVDLSYVTSGNLAAGLNQPGIIWHDTNNTASSNISEMIDLPRSPCALVVNPAATSNFAITLIGQSGW